jgi:ubiquinol-cytochrome c reductase iron-sulfur subunit
MSNPSKQSSPVNSGETTRRDFMVLTGSAMAGIGACSVAWPFIHSMNPAADVLALASVEVDLAPIQPGQTIKVKWRGVPVFIRHRTEDDIKEARAVNVNELPDPEADEARVKKGNEQWLIMVGVCTHLGCIPMGGAGEYGGANQGGWFCPCHGSHYDTSGRIRKGPAPKNMAVPQYEFLSNNRVKIG